MNEIIWNKSVIGTKKICWNIVKNQQAVARMKSPTRRYTTGINEEGESRQQTNYSYWWSNLASHETADKHGNLCGSATTPHGKLP